MLPKVTRLGLLFDTYGSLLTVRQRELMDLYYNQDWSLGEISREYRISRQAVYDILKRAEKSLEDYELRLGYLAKAQHRQQLLDQARELLRQFARDGKQERLDQVEEILKRLAEES